MYNSKHFKRFKKSVSIIVTITTIVWSIGLPFTPIAIPLAQAEDEYYQPEFWINSINPRGGGISTTLSGTVNFSGAVNSNTVSYSAGTADTTSTVFLLEGRYDWSNFDDWMDENPNYLTKSSADVETLVVAVNGNDSSQLDLSLSSGTLTEGTTYTLLVQNVCASGHTTNEDNFWQYCPMFYETFTTTGGASTGVDFDTASMSAMDGNSLCDGTLSLFANEPNMPLYHFNAFGDASLTQVKLYTATDPSATISAVKVFRDRTSNYDASGNWMFEPGMDTLLATDTTWAEDGEFYSVTLTLSPALVLPDTDPNGSLGFISIQTADDASVGTSSAPIVQAGSFTFTGTDGATLVTAMNTEMSNYTCASPQIIITSAENQASPYIQDIATTSALTPNATSSAMAIDFWDASGQTSIQSMTVNVIVPDGSGFDPQYGLANLSANSADAGVNIYQDNKYAGTQGSFDSEDTRLQLSSTPTWTTTSGTSKRTTLTFSNGISAPTSNDGNNAGADFFVVLRTSSMPAPGASFYVRVPIDGVVDGFPTANEDSKIINIMAGGGMMATSISISEIQPEDESADDEFIELYNPTSDAVDLSAYSIQYRNATSGAFSKKDFAAGATIPAYGFYLIAHADYDGTPTEDLTNDAFAMAQAAGTVFLVNDQTILTAEIDDGDSVVDRVAWGTGNITPEGEAMTAPAAESSIERKSWSMASAIDMASGGMDEMMGHMEDSSNNLMDFITQTTEVPQSTASTIENPMAMMQGGGGGSPLVINEVYNYPASGDTAWIELFNRSTTTQTITGWKIETKSNSTSTATYVFDTFTLGSGNYATVWWKQAGTDTLTNAYTANGAGGTSVTTHMSNLSGDVTLRDDGDTIKDYVQYGAISQPNEQAATTTSEWIEDAYVPQVLRGQTFGRSGTNGDDRNNAGDWQTFSSATQGTMNSGGDSFAPDVVTSVVLADSDEDNWGIDGNDVAITWTPNATEDPTFEKYLIYVLPTATVLNVSTQTAFTEIYSGQTTATFTGNPGMTLDSTGVAFVDDDLYRAYVVAQDSAGNTSSAVVSAAVALDAEEAGDIGADTQMPMIMHFGVWQAQEGDDIVLVVRIDDDRALGAVPGVGAQIVWKSAANIGALDMSSGTTATNCVALEANYYTCTIPSANAVEGQVVGYYLKSEDVAENLTMMSASPSVDMASYVDNEAYETAVQANPFYIDILADTVYTDDGAVADLTGTVYQSNGAVLEGAYVFIEGSAIGPVQTNASGVFSIGDDLVMSGMQPISIFKANYMDMYGGAFKNESNLTYYMSSGSTRMGPMAGMGGYMETPMVTHTNPNDGMGGVPIENFVMTVGFSKDMDLNTIVDNDAANAGSSIYLTTDGTDRIAGAVAYDINNDEATFTVTSGINLSPGTVYTMVISTSVTDTNGNSVSGGWRADGAYEITFNTMMDNNNMWGTGWEDYMSGGNNFGQDMGGAGDYFGGMDFSNFGQAGNMMPPYVKGTTPVAGAYNVNSNTSIVVEFSEPMLSSTINTDTVLLYPVSNTTTWAVGTAIPATVSLDSATQKTVTLNPTSNLGLNSSNDGWYVLKIMGSVQSVGGVWAGDPRNCGTINPETCLASTSQYEASFQLNTNADTAVDATKPTVTGTYPNNGDGIDNSLIVDVGIPSIEVGFSESMDPATINIQNIYLKNGSRSVGGKVIYDAMSNTAKFIPSSALMPNTRYTLTATSTVTDLSANALDQVSGTAGNQAKIVSFKTGSADATGPTVLYVNSDDYILAITFSEPVNTAKQTDASRWTSSALNPANYYIKTVIDVGGTGTAPYATATALNTISNLSFNFDETSNTMIIEGFNLFSPATDPTDVQIFVDLITDKSNNVIQNSTGRVVSGGNAAQSPIQSSANTYGMLGPGGPGMMMMGPMGGGGMMGPASGGMGGPGMDMGMMGMMGAGVHPMNMMAGQTSMYFVEFPVTKVIPAGGSIILTFPSGFNVANAIEDPYSPMNTDINEWNTGVVDINTVVGNQSARTVTITTQTSATQANDFLRFDLKGIINSSLAKSFGTDGYTVDIKTFNDSGAMLESITTMPFFLEESGAYTLSGTVTFTQGNGNALANNVDADETFTIFLGSPMTGPMENEITFDGSTKTANYSFTGLPEGEYHIFTDPSFELSVDSAATEFTGMMNPEPIWVNENTTTANVYDKDYTISQLDSNSGTAVVVTLKGDFTTNGVNNDVDIFANSYNNFRVKTVTPGETDADGTDYTLYLPDGDWRIGMGPAMPKGPMSGPAPMPDWMPPRDIDVKVASTTDPAVKERSGTANDGTIVFNISSQSSYSITGTVVDGSGNAIANAEVFANQPMGGFGGSFTTTAADGSFTLKIFQLGSYMVGVQKQGLPPAKEKVVDVRSDGKYVNGTAIQSLTFTIKKPSYTISGKVLNAGGNAVAYASVWAYQQSGWGDAHTMADSTGNYILYVDNGTWTVEADAPNLGWMQYGNVIVNGSSQSNINLRPDTSETWINISGTVTINGNAQQYMPISISQYTDADTDGTPDYYNGREFGGVTDSSGTYSVSVPGGANASDYKYYEVTIWTPNFGRQGLSTDGVASSPANIRIANADVTNANITIAGNTLKTATLTFSNKVDYAGEEAFVNIEGVSYSNNIPSPTGFRKSVRVADIAGDNPTFNLVAGDYHFFVDVPGYGGYAPISDSDAFDSTKGCITIDGTNDNITIALPDLDNAEEIITISGIISGPSAGQRDAWVWIGNPATGFTSNMQAATSTGAYSLKVPKLSSGQYMINADKPSFISSQPISNAGTADAEINFSLTVQTQTISGYIFADVAGGTSEVYDSGEGVAFGWIRAEEISTNVKTFAPVDGNGYYSLGVNNGQWRVFGTADSYTENQYREGGLPATITVSGNSHTNKNIQLSANANWVNKTKSSAITPASGGVIDDTAMNPTTGKSSGTGVKITAPPNALGSGSSSGNISTRDTTAVSQTDSLKPLGGKAKNITATDNSGQPITSLDNYIDIEMVTYKAEIDELIVNNEIKDTSKLKTNKIAYWNDSVDGWVNEATTKTAYYKDDSDTDWTLYNGTGTTSGYDLFIDDALSNSPSFVEGTDYDQYKFVYSASVNHLTVYAIGSNPDGVAPSAPTSVTQSSGAGTSVGLSWTAPTTNADATSLTDLYGYAVYRSTDGTTYSQISSSAILAGTTTYTDSTTSAWTSYYYKVTAGDDDNTESAYSTVAQFCSTNTVSNGSVDDDCTITCDSGFTQTGNTCATTGGGGGSYSSGSSGIPYSPNQSTTVPVQTNTSTGTESAGAPQTAPTVNAQSTTNGTVSITSANGGSTQVTTDAGATAQVTVPPNAVSANTTLAVNQIAVTKTVTGGDTASVGSSSSLVPTVPSGTTIVGGNTYNISAMSGETSLTSFSDSLTLTFSYTNSQIAGINENTLKVYYYNTETKNWVSLTSTLDTESNTITAYADHLTSFAIIGTKTFDTSALEGKVVKSNDSPAIYLVNKGYLRAFTSEMMYFSFGYKWSDASLVNASSIPLGPDMVYADDHTFTAGQMVKGTNTKVYFIDNTGVRHWVETEEAFLGLGYDWKQVAWISDTALAKYTEGDAIISSATRPDGSLIKYIGSDKVYLLDDGYKQWISTEAVYNARNYAWYNIIEIDVSETYPLGYNIY